MAFDVDEWREELESYRERKDEQFETPHSSPLGPDGRREFDGLDYFEPDPHYRVEATVELDESDETVTMATSTDGEQLYERVARLHFEIPDQRGEPTEQTLVGYRRVDQDDGSLFVPFRDKTTGQQTYPGGRYMELHYQGTLEDGFTFTLDFNLAYNPFCAFTEAYECPLPPQENWLEIAIPAGERYEA
ncbi:DUF1684 domain-containing protein [Natronomonas salsuginis]|jgi:uncharacterized protein (DUF1684 family)|uniref:DUF1684 domain-containing protein n=1 Tax=Natronomonas salsuginis TaxID=2217661 RepID=A0A4U5JD21_9EURY|nr:DUF1684 domain-containing protein [Natronomonas salsuginis]TKR26156.1 DUF1684 domain-containing protein [Natronomonas salsuginis]